MEEQVNSDALINSKDCLNFKSDLLLIQIISTFIKIVKAMQLNGYYSVNYNDVVVFLLFFRFFNYCCTLNQFYVHVHFNAIRFQEFFH